MNTRKLKLQARAQATAQGHNIGRFHALHSQSSIATCSRCYADVYVTETGNQVAPIMGTGIKYACADFLKGQRVTL